MFFYYRNGSAEFAFKKGVYTPQMAEDATKDASSNQSNPRRKRRRSPSIDSEPGKVNIVM